MASVYYKLREELFETLEAQNRALSNRIQNVTALIELHKNGSIADNYKVDILGDFTVSGRQIRRASEQEKLESFDLRAYWDFEVDATHINRVPVAFKLIDKEGSIYDYNIIVPLYLIEQVVELDEDEEWSPVEYREVSIYKNYLKDQVRVRYAMLNRPRGLMNTVMDSYVPKLLYRHNFNMLSITNGEKLPSTVCTISPWFANMLGCRAIPTEQLCRILGYDARTLKRLISKVKHKGYSISFAGYGGTGINTVHWLTEILDFTGSTGLFSFVEIFEPSTLEFSNLLRFPKDPTAINLTDSSLNIVNNPSITSRGVSKLTLLTKKERRLLSKNPIMVSSHAISNRINMRYTSKGFISLYDVEQRKSIIKIKQNHIIYGAPSLEDRNGISSLGHFISATHAGNSCQMWLNPTQDTDLQVESYGVIVLNSFFMNQLRMAIGLLEVLAGNVDLDAKDTELLSYSFDGKSVLPTDKTYNFTSDSLQEVLTLTTEQEAGAANA